MRLQHLLGLLVLINVKVHGQEDNQLPVLQQDKSAVRLKLEHWLKEKVGGLTNEIQETNYDLKSTLENHIKHGRLSIERTTTEALNNLDTRKQLIGTQCYQQSVQKLESAKLSSINEFLNCKNLTDAIHDVNQMIHETVNISTKALHNLEEMLIGLSECIVSDFFDAAQCMTNYIWKVINDVRRSKSEMSTYYELMKQLIVKFKAEINECLYQPSQNLKMQANLIMDSSRKCATKV
uniref:Putative secreted protein panstrongylus lignarius n=1 Tax=Rhodnius prolixus TaxID=13249 RepID=A0A4P6D9F6_RHOPR